MELTWREVAGALATLIALLGYIPYFKDLYLKKTKPHAFTWFIWALLTGIAFAGQIADNAGPGSWVTGFTAIVCFAIFVVALFAGEKRITRFDWICLWLALSAIPLWIFTASPLWSVIMITVIDAIGFFPTIRKAYLRPWEETASTYLLSAVKFVVALLALENFSIITTLYPASLVLMNGGFVVMLCQRRNKLQPAAA